MTRASLQAMRRVVTVDWRDRQEADAKALLLKTARQGHQTIMTQQQGRAGFAPDFTAYANRPGNEVLESVRLPGPIVYDYDYRREIVEIALGELIKNSPVESGAYVGNHMVFVDNQPVEALPDPLPRSAVIMLVNPLPYSRRLEVGKTKSGRDFVLQVEPRIYERVCKGILMPRFGNAARIRFTYVQLPDAYVAKGGLSSHYATVGRMQIGAGGKLNLPAGYLNRETRGPERRKRDQRGEAVRSPAIIIEAYQ